MKKLVIILLFLIVPAIAMSAEIWIPALEKDYTKLPNDNFFISDGSFATLTPVETDHALFIGQVSLDDVIKAIKLGFVTNKNKEDIEFMLNVIEVLKKVKEQ